MAVFSRIIVLAAFVSTALFVNATPENVNAGGQVTARHLKHPQPRAHHAHVAHNKAKRGAGKKRVCAAKTTTTTPAKYDTTTTTKKATTTTTKHTTTTTTTKHSTTTASSSGGSKFGLAINDGDQPFIQKFVDGGKKWCYTWSPWRPGNDCEFYPMLWGPSQVSDFKKNAVGKSFPYVLGPNEPEQTGQSHISVSTACSLWKQYIEPMDAELVSPAVTLSPAGTSWLKDFMNECGYAHKVKYVACHWYGLDFPTFKSAVEDFHSLFPGYNVWITEWSCQNYGSNQSKQCSATDVKNLMEQSMAWIESTSWIVKASWFGALEQFPSGFNTLNRLITSSGAITPLGQDYIDW